MDIAVPPTTDNSQSSSDEDELDELGHKLYQNSSLSSNSEQSGNEDSSSGRFTVSGGFTIPEDNSPAFYRNVIIQWVNGEWDY